MNWEQRYLEGRTPWEKGAPAPPLVDWIARHPGAFSGRVLVPGCGLGHDVRAIAAAAPGTEVIGIDVSPTALETAERRKTSPGERYETWDFFDLPAAEAGSYRWLFEHTLYCAIDPGMREAYAEAAHRALEAGGQFLAVFFLDPYDEDHRPGEGPPHGASTGELEERFLLSGRFREKQRFVPARTYHGREERELVIWMEKR